MNEKNSAVILSRATVPLSFIRGISKTAVTMDNGQELPLSRRLYESVNRAFIDYYRGEQDVF